MNKNHLCTTNKQLDIEIKLKNTIALKLFTTLSYILQMMCDTIKVEIY